MIELLKIYAFNIVKHAVPNCCLLLTSQPNDDIAQVYLA